VDEDDHESIEFEFPGLRIKKVVLAPGQSMGSLNQRGYEASSGRYIMLANDDVVLQTKHWDQTLRGVLGRCRDGVILAHVNDLVFQHRLCIFPIVSREYCEIAKGICPTGYSRYRIDDHIFATYGLAAALGVKRRIFFPFIIFEHLNFTIQSGRPTYSLNPEIEAMDEVLFRELHEERLRVATELCHWAGVEPSKKVTLRLMQSRDASHFALWPSKIHWGHPSWREFWLTIRATLRQLDFSRMARRLAEMYSHRRVTPSNKT
jgi:hypothetical protein